MTFVRNPDFRTWGRAGWLPIFSNTTPLAGDAVVTSAWEKVEGLNQLAGTILADQAGTLSIQFANTAGGDIVHQLDVPVSANTATTFDQDIVASFMRAVYTNGATPSTSFECMVGCRASQVTVPGLLSGPRRIGDAVNNVEFGTDGFFFARGDARAWEDVYPTSVTTAPTGPNIPAFTAFAGGLKAREFVGTGALLKELEISYQLNHWAEEGGNIRPHIHLYIPASVGGGTIRFGMEYVWDNVGGAPSAPTTVYGALVVAPGAAAQANAILSFGEIVGTGKGASSILSTRLFRDPADALDTFEASAWLKSADLHARKVRLGTQSEFN